MSPYIEAMIIISYTEVMMVILSLTNSNFATEK